MKKPPVLAAKPVVDGSRPEFPMRSDVYRKAGLLVGGMALAGGIASADAPPQPPPAKPDQPSVELAAGAVDGVAVDPKVQHHFVVRRGGGGIHPMPEMWEPAEVTAFINWTMAKEGKLAIKTGYKLERDDVSIVLDGFDADKQVGYVYTDRRKPSHVSAKVRAKLEAWQTDKQVAILFIDLQTAPDEPTIKGRILKFLAAVKKSPMTAVRK